MGRRGRGRGRGGGGPGGGGGGSAHGGQQPQGGGGAASGGAWGWGAGPPQGGGQVRANVGPGPGREQANGQPPQGQQAQHASAPVNAQQNQQPAQPLTGREGFASEVARLLAAGGGGNSGSNASEAGVSAGPPASASANVPGNGANGYGNGGGANGAGMDGGMNNERQGSPQKARLFEDLTSIDPQPRLTLEHPGCSESCRLIDLFCPLGRGQRALIVSPPKAGKTTLLKDIAAGIARNHPDIELIALLVDERPEEVTDFRRYFAQLGTNARVIASSNDNNVDRHTQISVETMNECKRGVVAGKHIVMVLDSITRLARAFNNHRRFATGGRTMTGGVDSKALEVPRQIFGSARNTEEAGSLTIIATCLVDTGSAMDQVIFEEFKGSGNMELILDRKIAEKRYFPSINLAASGTRKEHLLLDAQELKTMTALRRQLLTMPPHVQVERLLIALKRFATNADLVGSAAAGGG